MDLTEIEQLVSLVNGSDIRELTLRQGDARITIRKSSLGADAYLAPEPADDTAIQASGVSGGLSGQAYARAAPPATVPVTAPLVGVFHHVKPITGLGARVSAGQVVAVIESMRLLTDVTAPVDGNVVDVLIDDGSPVEYGQSLFEITPEPEAEQ